MSKLDPQLLNLLTRLAKGIAAVVGPHCEVVVHDFSDLEHSVMAIAGNVTGRKPGAPVPDLSFTAGELGHATADQINYHSRLGPRNLQSSTILIRDDDNCPIGAVCINVDYSELLQVRDLLDKLTIPIRDSSDLIVSDTFAEVLLFSGDAQFIRRCTRCSSIFSSLVDSPGTTRRSSSPAVFASIRFSPPCAELIHPSAQPAMTPFPYFSSRYSRVSSSTLGR